MEITAPTTRIVRPTGPTMAPAALASGVVRSFARSVPMMPSATNWIAMYSSVAAPSARKAARGTERDGFFTSPLGTSEPSIPENA